VFNSVVTDLRMLLRVPISVFFTLALPVMLLVVMMLTYGNFPLGGNLHFVDKYVLISIGMGIIPLTLITLPIWIGSSIESNHVLRLRYLHVNLTRLAISNLIAHFCMGIFGVLVNVAMAKIIFGLTFPDLPHFLAFFSQVVITLISMMLVGSTLGLLLKKTTIILPVGLILMFIIYMFCGAFGKYDNLPDRLKTISQFLPVKYLMNDSFSVWAGRSYGDDNFYILSAAYFSIFLVLLVVLTRFRINIMFNKRVVSPSIQRTEKK